MLPGVTHPRGTAQVRAGGKQHTVFSLIRRSLPNHRRSVWLGLVAAGLFALDPIDARAESTDLSGVEIGWCHFPAPACEPFDELGWEGEYRSQRVELISRRSGGVLRGTLFAPPRDRARPHSSPAIVIVPGSGGSAREENYHWSARELAAHGYVVLGVDPQGIGRSGTFGSDPSCAPDHVVPEYPYPCKGVPFQQDEGFIDAHISGVDFLLNDTNPWLQLVDVERVGLAGHSLGAGAAAVAQERDSRVGAIVAWDGLNGEQWSTDQNGAQHHLVAGHVPVPGKYQHWLEPRVPALGLHSGHITLKPYDTNPYIRSYAYFPWREAGMPVMTLNFEGVTHGDFGQDDSTEPGDARDQILQRMQYYTRAWFDYHLKGDKSGASQLLAESVYEMDRSQSLSSQFTSKAFLPSIGFDCTDFRTCDLPDLRGQNHPARRGHPGGSTGSETDQ